MHVILDDTAVIPRFQIGMIVRNETFEDYESGFYEPTRIEDAHVLGVHYEMVNTTLVELAHRYRIAHSALFPGWNTENLRICRGLCSSRNKRVHGWTADKEWMMKMMLLSGVDAIVTSYPKRLSKIIASWREICNQRASKRQYRYYFL